MGRQEFPGPVTDTNSLVGTQQNDQVGIGGVGGPVYQLPKNGNYVVLSSDWSAVTGAATWGSGTAVLAGAVTMSNSLIGSTPGDTIGQDLVTLPNGNYVVISPDWKNTVTGKTTAGAVTWGSGTGRSYRTCERVQQPCGNSGGGYCWVKEQPCSSNFSRCHSAYEQQLRRDESKLGQWNRECECVRQSLGQWRSCRN